MTPTSTAVLTPGAGDAVGTGSTERRSATRRVLRLELRRARAGLFAALVVLVCAFVLLDSDPLWPGRWLRLTMYLQASTATFVVPLVAAVAVWRGQRGHRAGTGDLLASTPRPQWHPLVLDWLVVTLPAVGGLLATWCAAAMAPSLTAEPGHLRPPGWLGGHWELILLATMTGLAAVAAVGLCVGRWISSRFAAPVVATLAFAAVTLVGGAPNTFGWLVPALTAPDWVSDTVPARGSALQVGFFAGVTLAALAAAHLLGDRDASRRTAVAALVPALAAGVACAVPLVAGAGRVVADHAALQPACTSDAPVVCVHQVNSFLLPDVTAQLRPLLAVVAAVGGPAAVGLERPYRTGEEPGVSGAEEVPVEPPVVDHPVVRLNLYAGRDGRLTGNPDANWFDEHSFARAFTDSGGCRGGGEATQPGPDRDWHRADAIATDLLLHEAGQGPGTGPVHPELGPAVEALHQQLLAAPSGERRRWLAGYYQARSACAERAVAALVRVP